MVAPSFMTRPISGLMPLFLSRRRFLTTTHESFRLPMFLHFVGDCFAFRGGRDEIPSERGREEDDSVARVTLI